MFVLLLLGLYLCRRCRQNGEPGEGAATVSRNGAGKSQTDPAAKSSGPERHGAAEGALASAVMSSPSFTATNPLQGRPKASRERRTTGFGLRSGPTASPPGSPAAAGAHGPSVSVGAPPGLVLAQMDDRSSSPGPTALRSGAKVVSIGSQRVLASSLSIGTGLGEAGGEDGTMTPGGSHWRSNPSSDAAAAAGPDGVPGKGIRRKSQWATGTGPRRLTQPPSDVNRILRPPIVESGSDSDGAP